MRIVKHLIAIILICALITLCMFRPFLPGSYDSLAVPISFMIQVFGWVGLLFVPLGLIWILIGLRNTRISKTLLLITLIVGCFVTVVVAIVPLSEDNLSFAILFLLVCFTLLFRGFVLHKRILHTDKPLYSFLPFYLIIIPSLIAIVRFSFIEQAVQYSKEQAIRNSEQLIQKIEQFHSETGRYPLSLQALHTDIKPRVVGISQYFYEPNGQAYNLYFEQFSDELDVKEIVMYNKLKEHFFTAHALDILEYQGQELVLRRGDKRRQELPAPNWISFKLD